MSRERTPAGNILALARSREEESKDVQEAATSYMPTTIDLDTLMPDGDAQGEETAPSAANVPKTHTPARQERKERPVATAPAKAAGVSGKRKRISLSIDDDVLTKIFRVSLESHEQLSSATHRLILEALKARGL
jgi:cytoskeletal protein RodZ